MGEYSPYHVFLSFRGDDTRKNFTDHLYKAMKLAGIHVFRDDDEIKRGEGIESEIKKAIQESKMSLIVFSKDYASSRYCLDEVVKIMEHREATAGHIVLPVFYDVEPSEVEEQNGKFADAFSKHERDNYIEKVEGWKAALRKVTALAGMTLNDRYEAQFIEDIVQEVSKKLNRKMLQLPTFVYVDFFTVEDINRCLVNSFTDVVIIGGIPGVGKTTIAKLVFNKNFEKFDSWSFLMDVRETSKQLNGSVKLQSQLLSDILKGKTSEIHNADEGLAQIRAALTHKRVLIVFDDVDDKEQLRSIIQTWDWLHSGSKVVITTRRNNLLSDPECSRMFIVQPLNVRDSLELFSWHAFRLPHPPRGYSELAEFMEKFCDGVPLALTVLGSSLCGRDKDYWIKATQEPEAIDGGKIQKIIGTSYHSLKDDRDRTLFLDIASIFIGEHRDCVDRLIQSCSFYRKTGLNELMDWNLVAVDKDHKLHMHPLIWNMAIEIVRKEAPEDLGQRTRIWEDGDAFKVLRNRTGTKTVRSLVLRWSRVAIDSKDLWSFNSDAFADMSNLRLLYLINVRLTGDFSFRHFPRGLAYVCWYGFPFSSIPMNFLLEDVVVLDLSKSILTDAWKGFRMFPHLQVLNLSHCHRLVRTPDFSGLPNLEILILMGCKALTKIDSSIEDLRNLEFINLLGCEKLWGLPIWKPWTRVVMDPRRSYYDLPDEHQILESPRGWYSGEFEYEVPASFGDNFTRTPSFRRHNARVSHAHQPYPQESLDLHHGFSRMDMGDITDDSPHFDGRRMWHSGIYRSWQPGNYAYEDVSLYTNPYI